MKLPIYALLGITTLSFACGGDEGEKIETSQVHKIVAQNTENAVNTTLTNANFLESSDLIEQIFGATGQSCSSGTNEETICNPRELNLDLDQMRLNRSEVSDLLRQTIFQDANVESSTETEIIYLIAGESVCGEADPMFPSSCITDLNKAQVRLRVTSPETNAVDIDVLVGPDRDNPISVEFHSDLLALEADLDGVEGAIGYLQSQSLIDNDLVLPTTFDGRVRSEVKVEGPQKISSSFSVLRAINVAGGDFGLQIDANEPTLQVTLDGAAKVITLLADVGKTNLRFQENGGTWEYNLAGIDGQAALSAQSDSIVFTGLGLGDAQSTLKIDGSQALSFDFNADTGRHIDLVASPITDGVKVDFADSVKAVFGLSYDNPNDNSAEWVKDDVLNVELEGATPSLILQNGEILEMLEGTLKLSLEKAGHSIEVTAGQCMAPISDAPVVDGGSEIAPEGDLVEEMEIVACE